MSKITHPLKDRLIQAITDALEDEGDQLKQMSFETVQNILNRHLQPLQTSYGKNGATVQISIDEGKFEDAVIESKHFNITQIFWRYEEDCCISQANLILALEGSVKTLKERFESRFGLPCNQESLEAKYGGKGGFWPDTRMLRDVEDHPYSMLD